MNYKKIFLKKGKESSLLRFHPWVFSGAVAYADKNIAAVFDEAVLVYEYNYDEYGNNRRYELMDFNGNTLIDLSKYNVCRQDGENSSEAGFYYFNNYFLTQIENSTGAFYCCLFDSEGNFVFEPIRMQIDDHFYPLSKNGFIYKAENSDGTKTYSLYRYDGTINELKYITNDIWYDGHYTFENGPEF